MAQQRPRPSSGYWYAPEPGTDHGLDVLNALRDYRSAETAMRRRTRDSMGMNETDLLAVRFLLQAEQAGERIGPKDLGTMLGISSASTTTLIDRLVASGHARREDHPTDRRALFIRPTTGSDTEVRATLGGMHARMMAVAASLSADEARVIVRFLTQMREVLDQGLPQSPPDETTN
ncbi:MarR family winged helix-turn-helix transcriptional regulator [Arthrobacter sp. TMN-37]